MSLDVRVGMASLSALRDSLKEYILAHVVDNKYVGSLQYLINYRGLNKFLEGGTDGTKTERHD